MIKKVLVFNYAGPEIIVEDADIIFNKNKNNGGSYYAYYGWQQAIASLMEGLINLGDITVFSTTYLNYGHKVLLKNAERKKHITALNYTYYSHIFDEGAYIEECEDLAEECDVIVIMEESPNAAARRWTPSWGEGNSHPTTYFRNEKGEVIKHLHRYMIVNYPNKVVFLETSDDRFSQTMSTRHSENQPPYYKIFFKREKALDIVYKGNTVSFPFAAEERYFTGGTDFEKIWANKKLDMVSLFRGKANTRDQAKNILIENFKNNNKCIEDWRLLGYSTHDIIPDPGFPRIHKEESEAFLQACISVDGEPGEGCYYTDRMFKSLAKGCCLFLPTPAYNVDFPNGFKDGVDVIVYDKKNLNDLIEKINYYLSNKEELKIIAKKGFENLLKYHTSEVRAKEFIETCERYMYD